MKIWPNSHSYTLHTSPIILPTPLSSTLKFLSSDFHLFLSGHTDIVTCLSHSSDFSLIVSGSNDGSVRLWNRLNQSQIFFHRQHVDSITSVSLSSENTLIVSGSTDKSIIVFCVNTQQVLSILNGHKRFIRYVRFTKNCKFVVSAAADRVVKVWDLAQKKKVFDLSDHMAQVCSLDVCEQVCATGDSKSVIKVWDVEMGTKICSLLCRNDSGPVSFLSFTNKTKLLAVKSSSTVILWNIENQCQEHVFDLDGFKKIFAAFLNESSQIVLVFDKDKVVSWDLESEEVKENLENFNKDIECVGVSYELGLIVAGHVDRSIKVYGMDGKVLQVMDGHLGHVQQVKISLDCRRIISRADDFCVRIWNLEDKRQEKCLDAHKEEICGIAFVRSCKYAISYAKNLKLYVWKV